MENYDMNIYWGKATIKVSLQFENYKGNYIYKLGGNVKGFELIELACDTEMLEQKDIKDTDCKLQIDKDFFTCELMDNQGNTCEISGELDELKDYIVKVEIIEFVEEEE